MNPADLAPYVKYKTARSSGSGGQHVNKVETKVVLLFDVDSASFLTPEERERIKLRLAARMQADGHIQVQSQDSRSQLKNKEIALERLADLLVKAVRVDKPRKKTKPSRAAVNARLEAKRRQSLRKIERRKGWE